MKSLPSALKFLPPPPPPLASAMASKALAAVATWERLNFFYSLLNLPLFLNSLSLSPKTHQNSDTSIFSRMISDVQNDSLFRINHYRPLSDFTNLTPSDKIGFGEHSDPQIFTILRSNDVGGLQISLDDGLWVPVSPDPTAYFIMIGDLFQVLTNGRFGSLKHRAVANTGPKPRLSMAYFASPSLNAWISPLQQMVTSNQPCLYRPFTWGQYKAHIYSLTLASSRLDSFKIKPN